jgi:hypothetical protein
MEVTGFTTWLLTEGMKLPEDDPVRKYAAHVNKDIEWPCKPGYQSFEEVEAHHRKWDNPNEDYLSGILYVAKLAWEDYEKWTAK